MHLSFCPYSGRRSLWLWSRRCRSQQQCSVRSSSSPASHGSCGLRSVPQPSGSARTCYSRSATPCTASWTWCASVSQGAGICVFWCARFPCVIHHLGETKHLWWQKRHVIDLYKSGHGYKIQYMSSKNYVKENQDSRDEITVVEWYFTWFLRLLSFVIDCKAPLP